MAYFWVERMLRVGYILTRIQKNLTILFFRMKRKYFSWDEAMSLREVKVKIRKITIHLVKRKYN
jgi:hypothetical protein